MLAKHSIHRFLGGFALAALTCAPVLAFDIVSEDGTVTFDEAGNPIYSGGEELFEFNHHRIVDPDDPENLLFGSSPQLQSIDPVEIFLEFEGNRVLQAPGFSALMEQSARGGLASSFSDMVLMEIAVLQKNCVVNGAPIENADIKPVYSSLRLHTNPIRTSATLEVFSYKRLTCEEGDQNIDIPLIRRWVMSIEDGLQEGEIDGEIGGVKMKYKMFARGEDIELVAYYSNLTLTGKRWQPTMRLISGFDEFGNVDPRDKYYDRDAASCVDIDFKEKPPNDKTIWSVAPSDMQFCARGCIPGDLSATK